MMCKHPFMRTIGGQIRWSTKLTEEEKLNATPFPCGKCLPCKINRSRVWQHRILLELSVHECGCFVTLTYDDDHIPNPPHLNSDHVTKFLKRLRRRIEPKKIRYFAVGEYGDKSWRPHYHLALFGIDMAYTKAIEDAWKAGFVMVGDLNKQSARYISGYIIKKLTVKNDTRLEGRTPEFSRSSRKDGGLGIGAVKRVAEQLKKCAHYDFDTIREFTYGKNNKLPLGRYLTTKLCEFLEIPEDQIKKEFLQYQYGIFDEHMQINVNDYYFSIQREMENERHSQEKRNKIFRARGRL